jgi:hypothetical protein
MQAPQKTFTLPAGARQVILVRHGSTVVDTDRAVAVGALNLADPELLPERHSQSHSVVLIHGGIVA